MERNKYKWDGDSRDERSSEFASSSFANTTAGVFPSTWAQQRATRKRRSHLFALLWPLLAAAGLSALALYAVVTHLRG